MYNDLNAKLAMLVDDKNAEAVSTMVLVKRDDILALKNAVKNPLTDDYKYYKAFLDFENWSRNNARLFTLWLLAYPYCEYSWYWPNGRPKLYPDKVITSLRDLWEAADKYWLAYTTNIEYLDFLPVGLVKRWEAGILTYAQDYRIMHQFVLHRR